jgi:hypothetical protein
MKARTVILAVIFGSIVAFLAGLGILEWRR